MKTMLATTASASVLVKCLNIIEYYCNTFEISLNIMKVNWILVKEELCLIASHLSLGVRVVGAINAEKTQLLVNKVKIPTKEFFLWTLPADQGINDGKRNGRQQNFVAWVFFWVEHSKARLTNVTVTMHSDYRLRCPIGFLNVQKKSKSKWLFLTQGTPKYMTILQWSCQCLGRSMLNHEDVNEHGNIVDK